MPLGDNVSANIRELYKDNKRSGKERGAHGKPRSRDQIIAIAIHAAHKGRDMHHSEITRGNKHKPMKGMYA